MQAVEAIFAQIAAVIGFTRWQWKFRPQCSSRQTEPLDADSCGRICVELVRRTVVPVPQPALKALEEYVFPTVNTADGSRDGIPRPLNLRAH